MLESNCEAKEFKPDPVVWYDDGNIVLIAGSTAFKLYKGILASVSPVFKDMFALAKPGGNSQTPSTIDGCPAVRVTDSPGDLRRFFHIVTTGFVEYVPVLQNFSVPVGNGRDAYAYVGYWTATL